MADAQIVQDIKLKICLVGDEAVGKTSLVRRFVQSAYDDKYIRTVLTAVSKKEVILPEAGFKITFLVWDIMGRKDFLGLFQESYFMNVTGIVAVFDVTRRATLQSLDQWIGRIRAQVGDIPTIILANKSDLQMEGAVSDAEIRRAAAGKAFMWLRTSAKTGQNVERAFRELGIEIIREKALVAEPANAAT